MNFYWHHPIKGKIWTLIGLSAGILATLVSANASAAVIMSISNLNSGASITEISGDGQIVVGTLVGLGSTPVYWTPTQGLVTVTGRIGNFSTISRDGSTMAGQGSSDKFSYSFGSGYADLESPVGPNTTIGVRGITDDGSMIVGGYSPSSQFALQWDTGGDPNGTSISSGLAFDVSANGQVIVGRKLTSNGAQAVRWMLDVPTQTWTSTLLTATSGSSEGQARVVSPDGEIVFGRTPSDRAFRWTNGLGTIDIGGVYNSSEVWDATADGSIAAGSITSGTEAAAAFWDETNGWRTLEDLLLTAGLNANDIPIDLAYISAISSNGRYLVASRNATQTISGETFWIDLGTPLTAVPLPAAAWLFGAGLIMLGSIVKREPRE